MMPKSIINNCTFKRRAKKQRKPENSSIRNLYKKGQTKANWQGQ